MARRADEVLGKPGLPSPAGRRGHTRHEPWLLDRRILLSEKVPVVQNAMALDETGNRLFLITHAGLTVVPLGPTQLSIGYLSPATGTSAGGTAVTLRGSGF